MCYFTELARWLRAHKRNRFLLTAPPLRLPGRGRLARDADRHRMNKVAIVTGGTSGMGEATAQELTKRGWQVAAMARSKVHKEFRGRRRRRTPIAAASPRRCSTSGAASTRW